MAHPIRDEAYGDAKTVVEEGSEFRGVVRSSCPVEVSGKIEGEIAAPLLVVSQSGTVEGRIEVHELRTEGFLSGRVEADTADLRGLIAADTVVRARAISAKLKAETGRIQLAFTRCEKEQRAQPVSASPPAPAAAKPLEIEHPAPAR